MKKHDDLDNKPLPLLIGSHVSFAKVNPHNKQQYLIGALLESLNYRATAMMIYTGAPQSTYRVSTTCFDVPNFRALAIRHHFDYHNLIVHAAYIFNPANPDAIKHQQAIEFLTKELDRAEFLGAPILVVHPGCSMKSSTEMGIKNCARTINSAFSSSRSKHIKIALETMAGKGTEIGYRFEHLRKIIQLVDLKFQKRIGVCVDTCHIYDAGYDIKEKFNIVMKELNDIIGFERVLVLHINDSKFGLRSHKDRHANINAGKLLLLPLQKIVHFAPFAKIIKILETPHINKCPPYRAEIAMLRKQPIIAKNPKTTTEN